MSKNVSDSCCQMEIPFEFLDVHNHPTPTDLQRNMSKELVEVYLKTCSPIERTLFGRDKALKGPGKLWINPDDRSSFNKKRLTPIKTENVQALTHQGILEIGKQIEEKINEKTEQIIDKAVADAEELGKFEANLRIKFHVETEKQKLNEQWQERINQLMEQQENEKNCIRKLYLESSELLREFIMDRIKGETEERVSKALSVVSSGVDEKCSEALDKEIARQSILFQEQMENTLKNLEINDKDRMEVMRDQCLKAIDLQSHLMLCRQLTEMMNLMIVEKKHWQKKIEDAVQKQTELENEQNLKRSAHQSKSIKDLLMEVLHQFDVVALDDDDQRIFKEIYQLCREFKIDEKNQNTDEMENVLIIQASSRDATENERVGNNRKLDWIGFKDVCEDNEKHPPFLDVKWEKFDIEDSRVENEADASFTSRIFNRFTKPHDPIQLSAASDIPQIASSIITMVKNAKNEDGLLQNITTMIHNVIMKKVPTVDLPEPAVSVVPMPKVETLNIRDSLETLTKRVSIRNEQIVENQDHSQLLAVVDSLELINHQTESTNSMNLEDHTESTTDSNESQTSYNPNVLPTYFKTPPSARSGIYEKMSQHDWIELQQNLEANKGSRISSVQFDVSEQQTERKSRKSSQRSSILKRGSTQTWNEIDQEKNALHSIHQKCREALTNMKLESVLKMLCDDDVED